MASTITAKTKLSFPSKKHRFLPLLLQLGTRCDLTAACSIGQTIWAVDSSSTWQMAQVQAVLDPGAANVLVLNWGSNNLCADVNSASTAAQATLCQRLPASTNPYTSAAGRNSLVTCADQLGLSGSGTSTTADGSDGVVVSETAIIIIVISMGVLLFLVGIVWVLRNHPTASKYLPTSPLHGPGQGFSWVESPKRAWRGMFSPKGNKTMKISPEDVAANERNRYYRDDPVTLLPVREATEQKGRNGSKGKPPALPPSGGAPLAIEDEPQEDQDVRIKTDPNRDSVNSYVSGQLGSIGRAKVTPRQNTTPRQDGQQLPGQVSNTTPRRQNTTPRQNATPRRQDSYRERNTTPRQGQQNVTPRQNTTPRRDTTPRRNTTPR
ncbi:unnamed protein product [Amoebophrya sp. A120]|nr:unnamed protein product [Amoebophrya sp. A120]|eukprot:GSA120T00011374001.1